MSVIIDQLRISDDASKIYINVHVNTASYFDTVYLDSLTIMTGDKVSETSPTSPTSDYIYKLTFDDNTKSADIVLDKSSFDAALVNTDSNGEAINSGATALKGFEHSDFSQDLFFFYFTYKTTGETDLPCSMSSPTVAVTFDENKLYQSVMAYTKEITRECNVSQGFVDFILLWNAFKASVETEHYISAIKFYNMLFGIGDNGVAYGPYGTTTSYTPTTCTCHG